MSNRFRLLLIAFWLPATVGAAEVHVPQDLQDWQAWVLQDEDFRNCPFYFNRNPGSAAEFVCAWPGSLQLSVGADGGRFRQQWTVSADDQWLPLPGDASHWPHDVTLDDRPATVVARGGVPSVRAGAGSYRLAGRFEWDERPGVLRIPARTGLVELSVDGAPVVRPEIGNRGIFLGERKQETRARDAVAAQVYRLVRDDVPTRLSTQLQIDVAGGVREELFGPLLPEGFVPLALRSELPARLEADGRLRVQVRPGRWQVTLTARAPDVMDRIVLAAPETNLPDTEIWSYSSNERLRVTAAEGLPPVDPSQVQVPGEWRSLPAFRIDAGQPFEITERSRGIVAADNELSLDRTMWLDYDGGGFVVADTIEGVMRTDWRLDMAAPFQLLSATEWQESVLITRGADAGQTGIEVRHSDVSVDAIGRSETRDSMSVTGWQQSFADVETTLNLPPGHKLLAAPGADHASGSWVSRWQLLDFFLVLIITIATWKLFGPAAGGVALVAVVMSFHEGNAPAWLWLNVLIAIALLRVAPEGRLRSSLRVYQGLSVLALVVVLVPFVAGQLRIAIYPQLEPQRAVSGQYDAGMAMYEAEPSRGVAADAVSMRAPPRSVVEEIVVTGAKQARSFSRYAPNAIVQAGPGIPSWQWNTYYLGWNGPIDADQEVRLVILPRWLVSLLRFVEVGFLLLFTAVLAAEVLGKPARALGRLTAGVRQSAVLLVAVAVASLLAAVPLPAEAQLPDAEILEELRSRLTAPPECVPRCAEIADAVIDVGASDVTIRMAIHALEEIALPMPGSLAGWRPEIIVVDGNSNSQAFRDAEQNLWLRVGPGRHVVTLRGGVPAVDSLEIPFPTPPRFVRASSENWLIAGIKDRRLLSGSLQLTRLQTDTGDDTARWESSRFPAFVRVERTIDLDLDWRMVTTVVRVAPVQGALTVDLPLVDGESVLADAFAVEDGRILVTMSPSQQNTSWRSTLERKSPLVLTARADSAWKEIWRVGVGSIWHADFSGVPESETGSAASEVRVAEFHPRGGETLQMTATRPEASEGSTLAFDSVGLRTDVGGRSRDVTLNLQYRSTSGSQHVIRLPASAEVTEVRIDGSIQPLRAEAGELTVPIYPGEHGITVQWREIGGPTLRSSTPGADIGAPSGNITLTMQLPADRWLLATRGTRLGPAVLYWSELAVLVLFALILGRIAITPLKTWHWLLLGLGFSTFSWGAFAWVVVWLLACGVRESKPLELNWWRFNTVQVGLGFLTLVAIASIVGSLPQGLLGSPDMHVVGNGSYNNVLNWFADRSDSVLPVAHAFSVPMWIYKVLILAWALWLSFALLRWLPWAWQCFSSQGFWRSRKADDLRETAGDKRA